MRGLFDYEYQLELINQHKPPLQKLNAVIDWKMFCSPIEEAFAVMKNELQDSKTVFDQQFKNFNKISLIGLDYL